MERVRSELFNAGYDWQEALAAPGVASYVETLLDLYETLPQRVAVGDRVDFAVGDLVADARHSSLAAGFSPASALADRAFGRLLVSTLGNLADLMDAEPGALEERWRAGRGQHANDLVSKFLGEVLGQYARHATDREAGRLAVNDRGAGASAQFTEQLASRATEIGTSVARDRLGSRAPAHATWPDLVARAFAVGRALPRDDG